MKRTITYALFLTLMTASALNAFGQTLPQGSWQVVEYRFGDRVEQPIDKTIITLNIKSGGRLGGKSGCNVYGGSYTLRNGKLSISDIISTQMFCSEDLANFERGYAATLTAANEFKTEKDTLTITDTKTGSFVKFEKIKPGGESTKSGN